MGEEISGCFTEQAHSHTDQHNVPRAAQSSTWLRQVFWPINKAANSSTMISADLANHIE